MQRSIGGGIARLINVASTLGGVVGLVLTFGPLKPFFLDNPLWGWALASILLVTAPVYVTWSVSTLGASRNAEIENRYSTRDKDLALVRERIKGWELGSDFDNFLTREVGHTNLPWSFAESLENRVAEWNRDSRTLSDQSVRANFDACHEAAKNYSEKIQGYMWERDISATVRERMKQGEDVATYLHVPPEWKNNDPERYRLAFAELEQRRSTLAVALANIHNMLHEGSSHASR